jgi:hypothetical protein
MLEAWKGGEFATNVKAFGQNIVKGLQRPHGCPLTLGMFLHVAHPCPKNLEKRKK